MNVDTCHLAGVCIFCGHDVPPGRFPWLFQRHTVHGNPTGAGSICPGSRSIYTLDLLGLRDIEPEHVPKESTGFTSSYPYDTTRKVAS